MSKIVCLIGFGGNLPSDDGGPEDTLIAAVRRLQVRGGMSVKALALSRLYRSPAYPPSDQPDYVNAVLKIETVLSPEETLALLLAVEDDFGRKRNKRWDARPIDLDLLDYGGRVLPDVAAWQAYAARRGVPDREAELVLPHPRAHRRDFVLMPVLDVAPDWHHPVFKTSITALIAALAPPRLAQPEAQPPAEFTALQTRLARV